MTERDDTERRRLFAEAQAFARDLGLKLHERIAIDDAAAALMSAGAALMAAALGQDVTARYLHELAGQIEASRPPQSIVN